MVIAVGVPSEANIPYFAMSVEPRDIRASATSDVATITKMIGKHTYQWLSANAKYRNSWRLIMTREFVAPKTAVYCTWLLFANDELEERFLKQFPGMSIVLRTQVLSQKLDHLRTALENGVTAGGYDLSKSAPKSRVAVARAYIEKHEQIEKLQSELDGVLRQEQERAKWLHLSVADFP